jgi:hypothetical protein
VSNAGNLLSANLGSQIDGHDAVFRSSYSPTFPFERHVGSRTFGRFLNKVTVSRIINPRIETGYNFTTERVFILRDQVPPEQCIKLIEYRHASRCTFQCYHANETPLKGVLRRGMSTGFFSMLFLSHVCDNMTAYGFHIDVNPTIYMYHYFNDSSMKGIAKTELEHWNSKVSHDFYVETRVIHGAALHKRKVNDTGVIVMDIGKLREMSAQLYLTKTMGIGTGCPYDGLSPFAQVREMIVASL